MYMEGKRLTFVLLVPLAVMLVMPVSTQASLGSSYTMSVECNSHSTQLASADLTFLGHLLRVLCIPGTGTHSSSTTFFSSEAGTFVGSALAGGNIYVEHIYYSQSSRTCEYVVFVSGPGGGSFATFDISNSRCT
jgi:hypothetical protein